MHFKPILAADRSRLVKQEADNAFRWIIQNRFHPRIAHQESYNSVDSLFQTSSRGGAMKRWMLAAVLMASAAVALLSAQKTPDLVAEQIARIEGPQSPNRQGFDPYTIQEIMKRLHIPGVSIAVVRDFQVQWTKTYGAAEVMTNEPVTPETRFQAASISKPVTAFAVLR